MAIILVSHMTGGSTTDRNIYGTNQCCQTFQITSAQVQNALYIRHKVASRQGTLGNITIAIYAVDGSNKPTGSALGTVTIASTNWSEIPGTQRSMENAGVEFTNCTLQPSTTYALVISATDGDGSNRIVWRSGVNGYTNGVSFISSDGGGTWSSLSGEDFHFQVWGEPAPPIKATNPTPSDTADDITLDQATVTWEDGGGATSYNVYYCDTSGSLTLVSSAQAGASFIVTGITLGSPYSYVITRYWRIDSTNVAGTTTGDEWSFATIRFKPPAVTYFYNGEYYQLLVQTDGTYGAHPVDGGVEDTDYVVVAYKPNFIKTTRVLVAAANSKVWIEDV